VIVFTITPLVVIVMEIKKTIEMITAPIEEITVRIVEEVIIVMIIRKQTEKI